MAALAQMAHITREWIVDSVSKRRDPGRILVGARDVSPTV
jgi:hypothetical protein